MVLVAKMVCVCILLAFAYYLECLTSWYLEN